ncbi:MAG: 4Fe-4S dicluster domain-containing protein [Nitrospirae bacterium]|nr:4Fe-4S dicluster domain-containing protein [Nitrospirota bacterium]
MDQSGNDRRLFMKNGLIAAAGVITLGTVSGAAEAAKTKKYAMIIDLNRCTGCQSCVIACKAQNDTLIDHFNTKVVSLEDGNYPSSRVVYTPVQCNQCENPPCVPACPLKATFKLANGIVVTDWDKCVGLGACVPACPYGARFLDTRHKGQVGGKVDKCDFCVNRLEQGLMPACVEACASKARLFGDVNAPEGEFAEYLKRTDLVTPKAHLKIKTSIRYVPNRRSKKGGSL